MDRKTLENLYLQKTRNGPVSEWTQRIYLVVKSTQLKAEYINWNAAPIYVINDIILHMKSYGILEELESALNAVTLD